MIKVHRWNGKAVVAGVMAASLLGACSSTSSSKSSATTAGSGGTSSASAAATGKPIPVLLLGTWTLPGGGGLPEVRDSMLAGIDAINASGGIKGRPIKPIVCDDQNDPNRDAQCTQQAISQGIVASIGTSVATFGTVEPLFRNAHIASIGGTAADQSSTTSSISFPITAAVPGIFAGMPEALAQKGAKKVALIYPSDLGAASAALPKFVQQGAAVAKISTARMVGIPLSTSDYGPAVASALGDGADAIATYMPGNGQVKVIQAIRAANPNIPIAAGTFALLADQIKALGSTGNGVTVVGFGAQPTSDVPAAQSYRADMSKYYPNDALSDQEMAAWVSVQIFDHLASQMSDITASNILDAMNHLSNYSTGGFTPPLTMTHECTVCGPLVRLFNPTVTFLTLNNGSLTQDASGQFHNAFTGAVVHAS